MKHLIFSHFKNHKKDTIAVLVLIILTSIFFYKSTFYGKIPVPADALVGLYHPYRDAKAVEYPNGMPFKNFLITDPIRQQIPWRKNVIDSILRGKLPLWDSTSFSGTPLLANIQAGVFYPFNILFLVLPFPLAWSFLIISQILCASIFFYIFLRVYGMDNYSSLFGAIVFAYSGTSIAWLTWGTILSTWMWTPLALAAVHKIVLGERNARFMWSTVLAISCVFSFFAGHLQIFLYMSLLVFAYTLWLATRHKKINTILVFVGILGTILVCIFYQLSAILKWVPMTSRIAGGAWNNEGFFIPAVHLIQFLAPDFFGNPATLNYWGTWNYGEMVGYIGIVGIIFALLGINKQTLFWSLIASLALMFSVQSPLSSLPYIAHIPILSSLQPTRLLFIVDLCLSVLAAVGFSTLMTSGRRRISLFPFYLVGLVLGLAWMSYIFHENFGISVQNAETIRRNLYIPSGLFLVVYALIIFFQRVKNQVNRNWSVCIFIVLITIDLFRFGWKFTPFTDRDLFFPMTTTLRFLTTIPKPFRIMTTDDRILPPNTNTFYGIESVGGYDPIHSLRYEQFIAAMERGKPDIVAPYGLDRIIVPKNYHSALFNLLSVKYILSMEKIDDPSFRFILSEGATHLYENTSVLPRAYLVENAIYKKTDEEIIRELYSENFNYIKDAVIETPVDVLDLELETSESARIALYEPDQIKIIVYTRQPRLLVVNNVYNPGWHAKIDGRVVPILRANYVYMSVYIPPGATVVDFFYK